VDEDGCGGGVDVEVVVAVDGEVPHPPNGGSGSISAVDGDGGAVWGAQVVTLLEGVCLGPLTGARRVDRTNEGNSINIRTR
jgi:hypothetical protein